MIDLSTLDDGGVYRLSDEMALVQSLDFFTPIVDDPFDFGRIAAANSLSDLYAMGAKPITALNILAFPADELDEDALAEILLGSQEICIEAGVEVLGGHSVTDNELKFGLSVTGTVHPDKILANAGAKPGDILILTKPLGTGLISNAMMNGAAREDYVEGMIASMVQLNRIAGEQAIQAEAHGATDITGFGLLGHTREMARASHVSIKIFTESLPLLPGALEIASSGSFYSGGERRNLTYVEKDVQFEESVPDPLRRIVSDPQTSGGLLISIPEDRGEQMIREMKYFSVPAWQIGEVSSEKSGELIHVI